MHSTVAKDQVKQANNTRQGHFVASKIQQFKQLDDGKWWSEKAINYLVKNINKLIKKGEGGTIEVLEMAPAQANAGTKMCDRPFHAGLSRVIYCQVWH